MIRCTTASEDLCHEKALLSIPHNPGPLRNRQRILHYAHAGLAGNELPHPGVLPVFLSLVVPGCVCRYGAGVGSFRFLGQKKVDTPGCPSSGACGYDAFQFQDGCR